MQRQSILVLAMVALFTGNLQADLTGYVSTYSQAVRTNFDTGDQTALGPSGIDDIRGLDVSPIDGTLYASDDYGGLWTVDTTTGIGSFIGNMGRRIESLSFAPDGTLYAIHRDSQTLKQINTSNGAATTIGSAWSYDAMAFAIDSTGRAVAWDYSNWDIFEIDLTNGSTTWLGHVDTAFASFDYGPDDVLYGLRENTFYRIDIDTLVVTQLQYINAAYSGGRGSLVIVPEPATLLLDPNGGETLTSGRAYPIKWSSFGSISDVLIEYSTDNGSSWLPVEPDNTGNNGLYNWLVPAVDSNQCLIRVSDACDPNISDSSNCVFTIEPHAAGYIVAWGRNDEGQCDVPDGSDFLDVKAGWAHSLALKSTGSLMGWGNNDSGQSSVPAGNNFMAITTSESPVDSHSLALKSDGSLVAWGNNEYGQCNVPDDNEFVDIAAGAAHGLALKADGSLAAWGNNEYGQCNVPIGNEFVNIAAGGWHHLALKVDGSLVAWGLNHKNQCNVPAGNDFIAIAAGGYHSLALKSDGSLAAWGYNNHGQTNVPPGNNFVEVTAGVHHNLAVKSDGSLIAWGGNYDGQCDIPDGNDFIAIAAGETHSLALVGLRIGGYIDWADLAAFCDRWLDNGCSPANWCGRADIDHSGNVDFYDFDWLGYYWEDVAPAPNAASDPNPNDAAINISITADLSWTAGTDTAAHGVYFGTNATSDANDFQGYQTGTTFDLGTLAPATTYYWQIDEVGLGGIATGEVWSFTTAPAPGQASSPNPTDTETGVSIFTHLSWTAGSDTTSFDVYFGTNPTPDVNEFWGNLWPPSTMWQPGLLDYETTYYWRIDALGPGGTTTGVIWSFTTEAAPVPGQASSPNPTDTETNVSITTTLSWVAGSDTTSHDVYFGTNATLDANDFQGYQTTTTFDPNILGPNTTYYWRIDEVGLGGTTTGTVWSFTTAPAPGQASSPGPSDTESGVSITTTLSWLAGSDATSHDVYFGTAAPGEFQGNQTATIWDPCALEYETTYYWRIDEVGPGGTTTGAVWSFTTEATPVPGQATDPRPTNGEVDVNTLVCLSWTEGPNTMSHDVYFGTSSPPPYITNQIDTTFCPPNGLEHYTSYYWRIDGRNPYNVTTGQQWSFRTDPDPDLVGWWMFNETSGIIAYDSSNKGNHGTLFDSLGGGLVWEPNEGALNFDGSNKLSRVVIPTTGMTTTAGTVAIWANLTEPQIRGGGRAGQAYFFGLDNGGINKILLYMSNSDTQLDMKIGNHGENNLLTLSTETWYHIALTWNAGTYAIYVDGSPLDTGTYAGLSSLPSTADIGNNGDSHTQSLHGLMGEVQVYDKALPADEIQELYLGGPN